MGQRTVRNRFFPATLSSERRGRVDSKETAADTWGGVDDDSAAPSPIASVTERATAARPPVQYADSTYLTPMAEGRDRYARIEYNCAR